MSTAINKTAGAARTVIASAGNAISKAGSWVKEKSAQASEAVGEAATAGVNFVTKHAATIGSVVVSTVVFAGCEAVLTAGTAGALSVPGAMACGALAGAAGSMTEAAIRAKQDGQELTLSDLGGAALSGGVSGALGGAGGVLLGKAVTVVGAKLSGPINKLLGRAMEGGEGAASAAAEPVAAQSASKAATADTKGVDEVAQVGDTVLYQKLGSAGEHLKYGITKNPATRYTSKEMNGGSLNILARGSKQDMLALERSLHETLPIGPEEGQSFYIQKQIADGLRPPPYPW